MEPAPAPVVKEEKRKDKKSEKKAAPDKKKRKAQGGTPLQPGGASGAAGIARGEVGSFSTNDDGGRGGYCLHPVPNRSVFCELRSGAADAVAYCTRRIRRAEFTVGLACGTFAACQIVNTACAVAAVCRC